MGKHEKRVYLEAIRKRYRGLDALTDKGKILDEFCSVCGYQRKYAIRLLSRKPVKPVGRPGRPSQYNEPVLLAVLRKLWLATDQMCSKRLVAAMPLWLPHYETRFGALDEATRAKLAGISAASIDRLLKPIRVQNPSRIGGTSSRGKLYFSTVYLTGKLTGGPQAKRKDFPISLAKQWNDKPNRYREPKGEEVIGIAWEKTVFPTRIHQWVIKHKSEPEKQRGPFELKETTNEGAAIIRLHQSGPDPLESCQ